MTNIIFFCVLLYGVAQALFGKQLGFETNGVWLVQTGAAILIGGGVTVWNVFEYVKGLIKNRPATVTPTVVTNVEDAAKQSFSPKEYELQDFSSTVHLRNRCALSKSSEGVELCSKLNSVLFNIDTKIEVKDAAP